MFNKIARFTPLLLFFSFLPVVHGEDQFFNSAGVRIHYTIDGKGEPVILIHGYAVSIASNWGTPGIIKGLSDGYQVIAIDNRGHGQSDKPHDVDSYGNKMVDDVIRLMDHLKLKKAHVVGYSMGGLLTEALGGAGWSDPNDHSQEQLLNQLADSLEQGKGIGPLIVALNPVGAPLPTAQAIETTNEFFLASNDPLALAAVARGHMPRGDGSQDSCQQNPGTRADRRVGSVEDRR